MVMRVGRRTGSRSGAVMYLRVFLLCVILLPALAAAQVTGLGSCVTSEGQPGHCVSTLTGFCPSFPQLRSLINAQPRICRIQGADVIFCCPDQPPTSPFRPAKLLTPPARTSHVEESLGPVKQTSEVTLPEVTLQLGPPAPQRPETVTVITPPTQNVAPRQNHSVIQPDGGSILTELVGSLQPQPSRQVIPQSGHRILTELAGSLDSQQPARSPPGFGRLLTRLTDALQPTTQPLIARGGKVTITTVVTETIDVTRTTTITFTRLVTADPPRPVPLVRSSRPVPDGASKLSPPTRVILSFATQPPFRPPIPTPKRPVTVTTPKPTTSARPVTTTRSTTTTTTRATTAATTDAPTTITTTSAPEPEVPLVQSTHRGVGLGPTPGGECGRAGGPWIVLVGGPDNWLCSGALVGRRLVLTSGRCVSGADVSDLTVRLGETQLGTERDGEHTDLAVLGVEIHPGQSGGRHDLALLLLSEPPPSAQLSPVCLPAPGAEPRALFALGWGLSPFAPVNTREEGRLQQTLASTQMEEVSSADCDSTYRLFATYRREFPLGVGRQQVCVAAVAEDSQDNRQPTEERKCPQDRGGPLVSVDLRGRYWLVGIMREAAGCGTKLLPNLYTRVTEYLHWLQRASDRLVQQLT